jgi:hypothetical protein
MAGTIIVDRIESDASYASTINVANKITFSNTANFVGDGNIGIGTSSPGCKLEVNGLVRATSLTNPTSGSGIEVGYDGTQGVIQAFSNRVTNTSVPINIQGDLKMNSGYGSSALAYGCRAWVNFNGSGTVAIRSSGNVSSITDNGVGDYTVNFTTAMPDNNYSATMSAMRSDTPSSGTNMVLVVPYGSATYGNTFTTSSIRLDVQYTADLSINDQGIAISVAIHR